MDVNDTQPTVRVHGKDGIVYLPKFIKNAKGEWELKDKSFQKLIDSQFGLERNAKQDGE
jgi:hypothetical protein